MLVPARSAKAIFAKEPPLSSCYYFPNNFKDTSWKLAHEITVTNDWSAHCSQPYKRSSTPCSRYICGIDNDSVLFRFTFSRHAFLKIKMTENRVSDRRSKSAVGIRNIIINLRLMPCALIPMPLFFYLPPFPFAATRNSQPATRNPQLGTRNPQLIR